MYGQYDLAFFLCVGCIIQLTKQNDSILKCEKW